MTITEERLARIAARLDSNRAPLTEDMTDCRDLLAELRATREQRDRMVNSYFESQTIRPDGEIGWPTFEQIRQRAEAAEAERDGAIRLNDTYQQDCTDLAAQVAALTAERDLRADDHATAYMAWVAKQTYCEELEAREAALRAALEHYADTDNWSNTFVGNGIGWQGWRRTFDPSKLTTEQEVMPGWRLAQEALAATTEGQANE